MIINFHINRQRNYSDADYVRAYQQGDRQAQQALYEKCRQAFDQHDSSFSGVDKDTRKDIFQDAYIVLWEKMEYRDMTVREDRVYVTGREGERIVTDMTNYFIGIVKMKYKEALRYNGKLTSLPDNETDGETLDWGSEDPDIRRDRIVNHCVKTMPKHCREILTMFYYEKKTLEEILQERTQHSTYDGLKNSKSKCMRKLTGRIKEAFQEAGLKVINYKKRGSRWTDKTR